MATELQNVIEEKKKDDRFNHLMAYYTEMKRGGFLVRHEFNIQSPNIVLRVEKPQKKKID